MNNYIKTNDITDWREVIKVRIWDKKNKKMSSPFELNDIIFCDENEQRDKIGSYIPKEDRVLLRYTGLDTEGVEVCEGDILRTKYDYHGNENNNILGYVFYEQSDCAFRIGLDYPENLLHFLHWSEGEVVGNVYEDSELLEEVNQFLVNQRNKK